MDCFKSCKTFIFNGLVVDSAAMGDWRKRLGGRLILERVQVKKWNMAQASLKAKIDPGTIKRIEDGGNYEIVKLEQYAEIYGRPLEAWLREILVVNDEIVNRLEEWSQRSLGDPPLGEARLLTNKRKGRQAAG